MIDVEVNLARANLYRYLCAAVLPPGNPRFELLNDEGFRPVVATAVNWIGTDATFHPQRLGPAEVDPASMQTTSLFPDGDEINNAYREVFGHSISKDCPPYENEYCANHDVTFRSQRLADIAGFYRAFGLDRSSGARERVDHLSFEAEFMQILLARQLYATEEGLGEEQVEVCRSAQRTFFVEHLGWWLPAFGVQLAGRTTSPFYQALGGFVRGFAAAERAVMDVPPFTELPVAHPDAYAPGGTSFECGLVSVDEGAEAPASTFPLEPAREGR